MAKVFLLFLVLCLGTAVSTSAFAHHDDIQAAEVADDFVLAVNSELLNGLPRTQVTAASHTEAPQQWEGVALIDVLRKAGAPVDKQLRGAALTKIVRITAADGYQILFSLAELDTGFASTTVILADKQNSKALSAETGPFRLVVPGDKRAGRWIRNIQTIELLDIGVAKK
jgi:DMSO/TMAO reductase YedYZ molybdopterin-dependent catalytic subunit